MCCYGLLERVQADLSKCLDKDISEGEREKILDREMDMKIFEVKERTVLQIEQFLAIWEDSVRATHLFLSENEISNIKKYVPQALKEVGRLVVAENASGFPIAFMGVEGQRLEMLFILPTERGKGLGKTLLQCGIKDYSVNELAVNEQNPLAKGFYEHMGFQVYKRAELDEQGNPYPLLYMRLD